MSCPSFDAWRGEEGELESAFMTRIASYSNVRSFSNVRLSLNFVNILLNSLSVLVSCLVWVLFRIALRWVSDDVCNPLAMKPGSPDSKSDPRTFSATQIQILDTAEKMFAEKGFDGTTLRNVVKEAGVNLASVSYHFGSKQELFRAAVARIAQPIVECELAAADELEARAEEAGEAIALEALLEAFFKPPLEYLLDLDREQRTMRAMFMGRCRSEPSPIQGIAAREFDASTVRFLDLLERALPPQSRAELAWKHDFAVALLIRTFTEIGQPHALLKNDSSDEIEAAVVELVRFTACGMRG